MGEKKRETKKERGRMKEKYCIFYENPAADGSLAEYSTEKGEKGRKRGRKKKEGRGKGC